MALPDDLRPSYHDPQLWLRLGPRVVEHMAEREQAMLTQRPKSLEASLEQWAYLAALRWVLAESRDLTRVDEDRSEQPGDED